jgi:N4-gp56 family major capsid protein
MSGYNMTTTSDIDAGIEAFFNKTFLSTPKPEYIFENWAQSFSLPRNNTTTMKFRKYNRLAAATTKLAEGITPNASKMSKIDMTASVDQYGDYVIITDVVELTTDGQVMAKTAEMQDDQVMNTRDVLCRDVLNATASVITCSHGTGTVTLLNREDIDTVCTTLIGNLAKHITDYVKAAQGQGTAPLRPAYLALFHYLLRNDLEDVDGFVGTQQYPQQNFIHPQEWGSIGETRWVYSTQAPVTSGTYSNLIFGTEAYGKIALDGGSLQNIAKGFGASGTDDPLNQRATIGWKMWDGYRIIEDLNIINLKSTAS